MKKKKILEILDSKEVIIGTDDKPQNDPNAVTKSNSTTDRAANISHQPFGNEFWGTFGFSLYEDFVAHEMSEEEMIDVVEEIIAKRTDRSINPKKDDKSGIISDKQSKIKELLADLTDRERADILKKV